MQSLNFAFLSSKPDDQLIHYQKIICMVWVVLRESNVKLPLMYYLLNFLFTQADYWFLQILCNLRVPALPQGNAVLVHCFLVLVDSYEKVSQYSVQNAVTLISQCIPQQSNSIFILLFSTCLYAKLPF